MNPARSVIDGELVYKFTSLSVIQKAEIAKKIGAKPSDLMDDLAGRLAYQQFSRGVEAIKLKKEGPATAHCFFRRFFGKQKQNAC